MCYNGFIRSARFFPALLAMRARHAVLPTRSLSPRPTHLRTSSQSAHESPQILFFVFKRLRTLSFSVSSKSFTCHSYENCRVCTNNSQSGTPHELAPSEAEGLLVYPERSVRRGTVLKLFLFRLLRTLLHTSKCQRLCFQAFPHSLRKTPGWWVPLSLYFVAQTFVRCLSTFDS